MAGLVTVHIDIDEVLGDLSDQDLIDELQERGITASGVAAKGAFTERDLLDLKDAAEAGRAWDTLAIVQSALCSGRLAQAVAAAYASLPRDPQSGRPVIQ